MASPCRISAYILYKLGNFIAGSILFAFTSFSPFEESKRKVPVLPVKSIYFFSSSRSEVIFAGLRKDSFTLVKHTKMFFKQRETRSK